jgi:hypothetical protein
MRHRTETVCLSVICKERKSARQRESWGEGREKEVESVCRFYIYIYIERERERRERQRQRQTERGGVTTITCFTSLKGPACIWGKEGEGVGGGHALQQKLGRSLQVLLLLLLHATVSY